MAELPGPEPGQPPGTPPPATMLCLRDPVRALPLRRAPAPPGRVPLCAAGAIISLPIGLWLKFSAPQNFPRVCKNSCGRSFGHFSAVK